MLRLGAILRTHSQGAMLIMIVPVWQIVPVWHTRKWSRDNRANPQWMGVPRNATGDGGCNFLVTVDTQLFRPLHIKSLRHTRALLNCTWH
jgi:hypothetical protein